jgi:regulator of sigma E protease
LSAHVFLSALIFAAAVAVHEAGHFAAARALGVPVREASLGFGPALVSWRRGGTRYALRLFPFGGYVVPERGAMEALPPLKQAALALAGPAANAAGAVLLVAAGLAVALAQTGMFPPWLVPVKALEGGWLFAKLVAQAFARALGSGLAGVVGPVGTVAALDISMQSLHGPARVAPAALVSMALSLTNLLPLPALDGGWALMALFRVPPAWQERAAAFCTGLLLLAVAVLTLRDVRLVAELLKY